jgi:hypothetical protein
MSTDGASPLGEPSAAAEIPPAPVPRESELWVNVPFALDPLFRNGFVRGAPYSIGWRNWPVKQGGPGYVVIRRSTLGAQKVVHRYPLTEQGWAEAWRELVSLAPDTVERVRDVLGQRADTSPGPDELQRLNTSSFAYLDHVAYLGGFAPGVELAAGRRYDVRFLEDRIALYYPNQFTPLVEVPYSEVVTVDVGGPGLTKTGGGFIGGGFGVAGAAEGMAVAAVLNALTTRVEIKTVVRVEASHAELFFLLTMIEPGPLRIALSPALGAIRQAKSHLPQLAASRTPAERLADITRLHSEGLLTDEEYQVKRAEIISQL